MGTEQTTTGPDAALVAQAEALGDAVARLRRVGLVVEPAVLSPENRRLAYAFVRHEAARIGFAYPNAR